ncbi:MAG: tyrosine-type recombinase/integrase [Acidimicrobiales bacterium]
MATKAKGRRPAGDGAVYRTADGRWRAVVDLGWSEAGRRRKYLSGNTQAEVRERLRKVQRDAESGVVTDERLTVGAFLTRWLTVNLPGNIASTTLDDYLSTVRLHLEPALGHKRLSQLSVADLDALWATKRKAGYKPNSVRIMRAVLRRALGQAEREGLIPRNVAALSMPPRVIQPEGRSLSIEQALSLLEAASGNRLEAGYLLMLSYGLRRGELLGLSWSDLDRSGPTLAVRRAVRRRKGARGPDGTYPGGATVRVEVAELKTRRSRRQLYLTQGIVDALDAHAIAQAKEKAKAGELWVESGLIFTSSIGTPIDPDNFAKTFVRLCQEAGLGHWHPHEARHSAASVMLAQGVPLEVVSEVLGHSSIAITKDVYGHLVEGAKRSAAERMAAVLRP